MVKRTSKLQKQTVRRSNSKSRVGATKKKSENQETEKPLLENKELLKEFKELEQIAKQDPKYPEYKVSDEYKTLKKVNPTIFYLQHIFHKEFKKSFIELLLDEDNVVFANCLTYYLHLKNLIKESPGEYPILEQLIKHGFNTIYDILLENNESFYLISFLSHLSSFELIENPNEFLLSLKKNKLYQLLRKRECIEALQKKKLYTRIKKYQL